MNNQVEPGLQGVAQNTPRWGLNANPYPQPQWADDDLLRRNWVQPRQPLPQLGGQPPSRIGQFQQPVANPQLLFGIPQFGPLGQPTHVRNQDQDDILRGAPGNGPDQLQDERNYNDLRSLKLEKFTGKHVESFCDLFERISQEYGWTEEQRRLHLLSRLDSSIRNMFLDAGRDISADDMMHTLTLRFGVNLSQPDVYNRLRKINRKPNEDLYSLCDRVQNLVRRADIPYIKRRQLARDTFFAALADDSNLQHWVGTRDTGVNPDIYHTLSLATYWERMHGTRLGPSPQISERFEPSPANTTTEGGDVSVNRLSSMRVADRESEDVKRLAHGYSDLMSLIRKQTELTLEEQDRRSDRCRSRDERDSRSDSSWSSPDRSWSTRRDSSVRRPDRRSRSRHHDDGQRSVWKNKSHDKKGHQKENRKRRERKQAEYDESRFPPELPSYKSDPDVTSGSSSDE